MGASFSVSLARFLRFAAVVFLLCFATRALLAAPAPAKAPPAAAPVLPAPGPKPLAESLTGDALAAYEAGRVLYSDGDYAGSLVKLQAAYDLSHDPRLLWNMAACEKNLRHYAKVLSLVRTYLDTGGDLLTEQDRLDAKELLATVESFTAALKLTVTEAGAEVYVDDARVGTTPLLAPVVVDIGTRRLRVSKPGFADYVASIPIGGAAVVEHSAKLKPDVHEGRLSVRAQKDATITLDGKAVGKGSWSGVLPTGGHTLRVTAPGMLAYQSEVVIQDNEIRSVDVPLEPVPKAGPPVEEHGALYDMEIGVRTGYGVAFRRSESDGDVGDDVGDEKVGFIPLWLDIGYRLGRPTYLGIYGQYGVFDRSGTCGIRRHGPDAEGPTDISVRYAYTSCSFIKAGVMLVFHVLPRTIVDPWFGFDVGGQVSLANWKSYDPLSGASQTGNDNNGSFQPGFQLGVDTHPWPTTSFGLFGHVGPDIGEEGKPQNDDNGGSTGLMCPNGCCPGAPCGSQSNPIDGGGGITGHYLIGVRAAYTFP